MANKLFACGPREWIVLLGHLKRGAAQITEIKNTVDRSQEMIWRHMIFEVERVEDRFLIRDGMTD
jgi:hypothetical protein